MAIYNCWLLCVRQLFFASRCRDSLSRGMGSYLTNLDGSVNLCERFVVRGRDFLPSGYIEIRRPASALLNKLLCPPGPISPLY